MVSFDQVDDKDMDLGELTLISSQLVHLYSKNEIDKGNTYRLVIAERKDKIDTTPVDNKGKYKKNGNIFYFITMTLSPKEIVEIMNDGINQEIVSKNSVSKQQFKIFANRGCLTILAPHKPSVLTNIKVLDIYGQTLIRKRMTNEKMVIDNDFKDGLYIVTITSGEITTTKKMLLK